MIAGESWPRPAAKLWELFQRFQKFLVVGAVGFLTNQALLWYLHEHQSVSVPVASPIAILVSMVVTFVLNERWTWHDRGTNSVITRASSYVPINIGGLAINWGILWFLHSQFSMNYLIANLIGAGIAAIWNFVLNNAITWRS